MQWSGYSNIEEVLPGAIPLVVTPIAIVMLIWQLSCLLRRKKFVRLTGYLAFVFSQGCVGVLGMVAASMFYDLKPKFNPQEFSAFMMALTTFGALSTLFLIAWLSNSGFWPNMFVRAEKKLPRNNRVKNLTFSIGVLSMFYGGLLLLYFYGPENFTPNRIQTSKGKLGELMLGQTENLLTWAWVASALLGMIVAFLIFVLFFEITKRETGEFK